MIDGIKRHLVIRYVNENEQEYKIVEAVPRFISFESMFGDIAEEWEPKENEIICLFPQSNVDRSKFKSFCESKGYKTTRDYKKATTIFASPKKFKGTSTTIEQHDPNVILQHQLKHYPFSVPEEIKAQLDELSSNVLLLRFNYSHWQGKWKDLRNDVRKRHSYTFIHNKAVLGNLPFYKDSCLIRLLNSGTVIDEEAMINIGKMLESEDSEMKKLAIKMICNADFNTSALHLLLLLQKYRDKFNDSITNRASFRSVMAYFNIDRYELQNGLTNAKMIEIMKHLDIYNPDSVKKLAKLADFDFKTDLSKGLMEPVEQAGFINDADEIDIDIDF